MRREWLMVLLVVVLLVPVGCGPAAATPAAAGEAGLSDSATHNVQVEPVRTNQPPTAVISGPTSGLVGGTLSFSGADSTDKDGRIVSYAWDFGDGTTGSGVSVTHIYKAPGSYKVTLTVTDDAGLSASASEGERGTGEVSIQTASTTSRTYTVKSGDTLMEISRKLFNGDPQYWDEIAELNGLNAPYTIHPGDVLKVP
jgi:PKD repeat protein